MNATLPKATKRNSLEINGQQWHFRKASYWSPGRFCGHSNSVWVATRYSDSRSVTGSDKDRLVAVIAARIEEGVY